MPYVNIRFARGKATTEQKEELAREITELLARKINAKPHTTFIIFDEVEKENWAIGGETVAQIHRREGR